MGAFLLAGSKEGGRQREAGPAVSPDGKGKVQTKANRELRNQHFGRQPYLCFRMVDRRDEFTLSRAKALLRKAAAWRPSKNITKGF